MAMRLASNAAGEIFAGAAGRLDLQSLKQGLIREQRRLAARRFFSNRLAVSGLAITMFIVVVAIAAPLAHSDGPLLMVMSDRMLPPGGAHLFGTDTFGRDLLSRVLYGTRTSLVVGGSVCALSMGAGLLVGLYSSYYRWLDNILMRICDGLNAIPATLLAIALMAMLGGNIVNVIACMSVVFSPFVARVTRASALSVKEQTYVEAIRAHGARPWRIILMHILPNIIGPVIVQASFIFAGSILAEAMLSFLGVGIPAPAPSWGNIIFEGKAALFNAPWIVVFPGAFSALTVFGLNLLGDGLRDVIDPRTN
jgi:peptide/nickel transport system permease protein